MEKNINRGAVLIRDGRSVLFSLIEDTQAGGGLHTVRFLYNPSRKGVYLEAPKESVYQKGQFDTVLHALEAVTAVTATAYQGTEFSSPQVLFVRALKYSAEDIDEIQIPLTVGADSANIIALHRQVHRVDPEVLARGYYEAVKQDPALVGGMLRRVMIVEASFEDRLSGKQEAIVRVLPQETLRGRHRLMHPGRIANWFTPNANRNITVKRSEENKYSLSST